MLSTPFIRCTNMCFRWICYKGLRYPDDLEICCFNLRLHVQTSHVSRNILLKNMVWDCVVDLVWGQLLNVEWEDGGCCGWWFFLLLLLGWSESVSSVVSYDSWSLIAEVVYLIQHQWQHWILGKVGQLVLLLEQNLVLGYILAPDIIEAGREMIRQTYVKICRLLGWLVVILYPPFPNSLVSLIMRWALQIFFFFKLVQLSWIGFLPF